MKKTTPEQLLRELEACKAIGMKPVKPARVSRTVDPEDARRHPDDYVIICGDKLALRCKAKSKQAGRRCKNAAAKGMQVCRFHGGASTGSKTPEGRRRQAATNLVHGRETRANRRLMKQKTAEFRILERVMRENNYFRTGNRR